MDEKCEKTMRPGCIVCNKTFASEASLRRHMACHTGAYKLECSVCHKPYSRSDLLKEHELTHTGRKDHKCDLCGRSFLMAKQLRKHQRYHSDYKPYSCSVCGKLAVEAGSIKKHIQAKHKGEEARIVYEKSEHENGNDKDEHKKVTSQHKCNICAKNLSSFSNLKKHMRTHVKDRPYSCGICGFTAMTSSDIKIHLLSKHKDNTTSPEYRSDMNRRQDEIDVKSEDNNTTKEDEQKQCYVGSRERNYTSEQDTSKQTAVSSNTAEALNQFHTRKYKSLNKDSDERYEVENNTHRLIAQCIHIGEKEAGCVNSGSEVTKLSKRKSSYSQDLINDCKLDIYVEDSNSEEEITEDSPEKGVSAASVSNNSITNDVETPSNTRKTQKVVKKYSKIKPYSCSICGKKATEPETIKRHIIAQHKETATGKVVKDPNLVRQHKCETCGKCFPLARNLRRHLNTHSSEKRYSCSICGKAATESSSIKKHIQTTHRGKPGTIIHKDGLTTRHINVENMSANEKENKKENNVSGSDVTKFINSKSDYNQALKNNCDLDIHVKEENEEEAAEISSQEAVTEETVKTKTVTNVVESHSNHVKTHQWLSTKPCPTPVGVGHSLALNHQHNGTKGNVIQEPNLPRQHKCETCGKFFNLARHLKIHLSTHIKHKRYSCSICGKTATVSSDIKKHILGIHRGKQGTIIHKDGPTTWLINVENKSAHQRENNKLKKSEHTVDKSSENQRAGNKQEQRNKMIKKKGKSNTIAMEQNKCDICGKYFSNSINLKVHINKHSVGRPYSCSVCGQAATDPETIKRHINAKHKGTDGKIVQDPNRKRPHECETCGKCFNLARHLKRHLYTHSSQKPFFCSICGKTAIEIRSIRKHIQAKHRGKQGIIIHKDGLITRHINVENKSANEKENQKENKCQRQHTMEKICENDISENKEEHTSKIIEKKLESNNTAVEQMKCDICGKYFSNSFDLRVHMKGHNIGRPYSCSVCGYRANESSSIRKHFLAKHKGTSGKIQYDPDLVAKHTCNTCGKSFSLPNALRRHQLIHSNVRPFSCSICGRRANEASSIKNHILAAHKESANQVENVYDLVSRHAHEIKNIHGKEGESEQIEKENMDQNEDNQSKPKGSMSTMMNKQSNTIKADIPVKNCFVYLKRLELSELISTVNSRDIDQHSGAIESVDARITHCQKSSNRIVLNQEDNLEDISSSETCFKETESDGKGFVQCIHNQTGNSESILINEEKHISSNNQSEVDGIKDTSYKNDASLSSHTMVKEFENSQISNDKDLELFDRSNCADDGQNYGTCNEIDEMEEQVDDASIQVDKSNSESNKQRLGAKRGQTPRHSFALRHRNDIGLNRYGYTDTHKCICGKLFKSEGGLCCHRRKHRNENKVYKVKQRLKHKSKSYYKRKERTPPSFKCDICDKLFATDQYLQKHRAVHTEECKRFECTPCGQVFMRKDRLNTHNTKYHPELSNYDCSKCGKGFNKRNSFFNHGCKPSLQSEPYLCDECGKLFQLKSCFNAHLKTHSSVKEHMCYSCGKRFTTIGHMKRHMVLKHSDSKPFSCDKCDEKFKTKDELRSHNKHINHEKFISIKDLNLPVDKHDDLPYEIEKKVLKCIHTCGKVFSCDMCSKVFEVKGHFDRHMLHIHGQNKSKKMAPKEGNKGISDNRSLSAKQRLTPVGLRRSFASSYRNENGEEGEVEEEDVVDDSEDKEEDNIQQDVVEDSQHGNMNCDNNQAGSSHGDALQQQTVFVEDNENEETGQEDAVDDNENEETVQEIAVEDNENEETGQEDAVDDNENEETVQKDSVEDNENEETIQQGVVDDNENEETVQKDAEEDNENEETRQEDVNDTENEDTLQGDAVEDNQQEEVNLDNDPAWSSQANALQKRKDHQHKSNSVFQCGICHKTYTIYATANNHIFTHLKEKIFDCKICKKLFRTPVSLRYHMDYHGQSVSCEFCEKKLLKCKLSWHMKSRHPHQLNMSKTQEY